MTARMDDLLLMAYVDGEVDAATAREIEATIAADADVAARVRALRDTGAFARSAYADVLHEETPRRLIATVTRFSPAAAIPVVGRIIELRPRRVARVLAWAAAAVLAALVIGSGGLMLTGTLSPPSGLQLASSDRWLDHVAGFYEVYAKTKIEEERLLVDFDATDLPELNRWFGARLGRPLQVPDLSAKGFHIQGGRLLIIGGKPAAQFLYYAESGDLVGLVVAFSDESNHKARQDRRKDLNIVHWRKAGYAYALVGKLEMPKLQGLADDAWQALDTI